MAKFYKTPDILKYSYRKDYYTDKNGEKVYTRQDDGVMVDSVSARLLKEIDKMIAENLDLSVAQIMRRAKVEGFSKRQYMDVYKDTVELIKKYQLGIIKKDDDIPMFDSLDMETQQKTKQLVFGIQDEFDTIIWDAKGLVSEELSEKSSFVSDAYIARASADEKMVPELSNINVNDMFSFIEEKYKRVQELKKEYESLFK